MVVHVLFDKKGLRKELQLVLCSRRILLASARDASTILLISVSMARAVSSE